MLAIVIINNLIAKPCALFICLITHDDSDASDMERRSFIETLSPLPLSVLRPLHILMILLFPFSLLFFFVPFIVMAVLVK